MNQPRPSTHQPTTQLRSAEESQPQPPPSSPSPLSPPGFLAPFDSPELIRARADDRERMRELILVVGDGSVSAEQAVDASQAQTTELSSTAPPSTQMSSTPSTTEETEPLQALLPISIPTLPLSAPVRRRIGVLVTMFWGFLVTRGLVW